MNEVEKMYRNSGIEKHKKTMLDIETGKNVLTLDSFYPEFTAEKQLELIKWLALRDYIAIVAYISGEYHSEHDKYNANENSLEDCLARLINNLWQDLTEEEQQQIKNILESEVRE